MIGAGPPALLRRNLTEESLTAAIVKLLEDPAYADGAATAAAGLAKEDGVANAVRTIERYAGASER